MLPEAQACMCTADLMQRRTSCKWVFKQSVVPQMVKADLMATAVRDRALKGRTHSIHADAPVNGVADPASDMWAAGAA